MAFGAGVLISAVAYDLVLDAFNTSNGDGVALGLAAGALSFYAGDVLLARQGAGERKRSQRAESGPEPGSGSAIVLGMVLDGIPESIVIGVGLLPARAWASRSWLRSSSPTCRRPSRPRSDCAGVAPPQVGCWVSGSSSCW